MLLLALHETILRKPVLSYYDLNDTRIINYHKFTINSQNGCRMLMQKQTKMRHHVFGPV